MMHPNRKILAYLSFLAIAVTLSSCAGEDYTPVYFPPPEREPTGPTTSINPAGRQCTLSFTSELCVKIKGDNVEVGVSADDELCEEVPAFPIHIRGTTVSIRGNEFPDIQTEGHGLPAPITINAKGASDGRDNTGEGTIDARGNITIEGFSLFIVALGVVGEIPNLTLTTGATEELPDLDPANGSAPDASGAMTLVTGTVLGHTIDAADRYLMGASLTAAFTGALGPPLAQCGGEGERSIEVKRLIIEGGGRQSESPIPDGSRMEVSGGTYVAEGPSDVGERFEATARFRVRNIGTRPQSIEIPPRVGPFYLSSIDPLTRTLPPQQSFILNAIFKPATADGVGELSRPIPIGIDQFELIGTALSKSGRGSVNVVDDNGEITLPDVGGVDLGAASVRAGTERAFFTCGQIPCNGQNAKTNCQACGDPTTTPCDLLAVSTSGRPMGEVNAQCEAMEPNAVPLYTIDLSGSSNRPAEVELGGHRQVLAIRNRGVAPMQINSITIQEVAGSQSTGQFAIPENAIFVATRFSDIQGRIEAALSGQNTSGQRALPLTLEPFYEGYNETTVYVVVTYQPSDLLGADGSRAGVGSPARDRAIVRIQTSQGEIATEVTASTTITETPALELYFRTWTGTRQVTNDGSFPFKGVTGETLDLAVPLFLRVADTATLTLRITSISINGTDAANFRWLDSTEEIAAVTPPSGRGMRCSVPTIDESTGQMTDESFDLRPVALTPPGFDIAPGAYSLETMPFFGCVDFHREEGAQAKQTYVADIIISAQEITPAGMPARNPDGSLKESRLSAELMAVQNPRSGKTVMRITQTMAAILNPQFPGISAIASRADSLSELTAGRMRESDLQVLLSSLILDPFDEETIRTSDGTEIVSRPNDGWTMVFRALDTHPVTENYPEEGLFDYASLLYNFGLATGAKGIFEDYPNKPDNLKSNSWRIFTSALSYPGPLDEPRPVAPSACEVINPCSPEGQRRFTRAGIPPGEKGACAFFYASGSRFDSPAFQAERAPLCSRAGQTQSLIDVDTGIYTVDGRITAEEMGLRFFGPTFFHNPGGPSGPKPPLDEIFHMGFTTGVLKPQSGPNEPNVLPDERINLSRNEYKINLTERGRALPAICQTNTRNRAVGGRQYSTWRYIEGMLFKDEAATIPAGCPEDGNNYDGGMAYLKGRDLNQETGVLTLVAAAKFSSSDDLTFAFKDMMLFIVLNGWLCDPTGRPEDFEGARCYDVGFNDRDAVGQISIIR